MVIIQSLLPSDRIISFKEGAFNLRAFERKYLSDEEYINNKPLIETLVLTNVISLDVTQADTTAIRPSGAAYVIFEPAAKENWPSPAPKNAQSGLDALAEMLDSVSGGGGISLPIDISDVDGLQTAINGKEDIGVAEQLVGDHEESSDPHPQYATDVLVGSKGKWIYIDRTRVDEYTETGSFVNPFKTIQSAIDHASSNGDGGSVPYSFAIASGTYQENVNLNGKGLFSITMIGLGRVAINPLSGDALQSNSSNSNLQDLVVNNIEFGRPVVLLGDGTSNQFKTTEFKNCSFSGAADVSLNRLNNFAVFNIYSEKDFTITNVNYCFFNSGQIQGLCTMTMNSALPQPANGVIGGANLLSMIMNNISLNVGGSGVLNFAPHACRIGTTAGSVTIPSGCNVIAYNSLLRGNWTNNGALILRNSHSENSIAGTAPTITANRSDQTSYVPADPTNWSGSPANLSVAIERMASLLKTLNSGNPIP